MAAITSPATVPTNIPTKKMTKHVMSIALIRFDPRLCALGAVHTGIVDQNGIYVIAAPITLMWDIIPGHCPVFPLQLRATAQGGIINSHDTDLDSLVFQCDLHLYA
jgi:hypothetical protein